MYSRKHIPVGAVVFVLLTNSLNASAQEKRQSHKRQATPQSAALFQRSARATQEQLQRTGPVRFPASANFKAIIPTTCPPEASGAVCGYVKVPLDRSHPKQAQIPIYFELYPHTASGPAESAIVGDPGGGGGDSTTIDNRLFFHLLFARNMEVHDLLLVDGRGRGYSQAIDCAPLQHGTEPFTQATADCAAQLGLAASRYGAGDVVQDIEAVRAALGYDKLDYYGGSYGGVEATAYATRFGEHLRSVILDSPLSAPQLSLFAFDHDRWRAIPQVIAADCKHSPTCAPDHPDAIDEVNELVASIRAHPIEGDAHDAGGNLVHVRIDETALLNFVLTSGNFAFNATGEVLAAAAALRRGDTTPLLRLAAEGFFTLEGDSGDATAFSVGAEMASCVDLNPAPWDWSSTVETRQDQFANAVAELPANYFAPFSRAAGTNLAGSYVKLCLWWEEPTPPSPVLLPNPVFPHVPTLVLSGELDNLSVYSDPRVAALFPDSVSVTIPESGHKPTTYLFSGANCARDIASDFLKNLQLGDTSCAKEPFYTWPAVGRFPLFAREARPAEIDVSVNNEASVAERKVATVAVAAVTDALQRAFSYSGDGAGLRGGTYHADYNDTWTITLTDCAFAKDVVVNGTINFANSTDSSVSADVNVSGPGTQGGALHIEGNWMFVAPGGTFKVSGILGGRRVAVWIPEA